MVKVKRHEIEGLEGIPEDIEPQIPKNNSTMTDNTKASKTSTDNTDYSSGTRDQATLDTKEAIRLLERVFNWCGKENENLPIGEQLNFIAIGVNYTARPLVKDGKIQVDETGKLIQEKPSANIQLKLNLTNQALSLPLHESVSLPGGN